MRKPLNTAHVIVRACVLAFPLWFTHALIVYFSWCIFFTVNSPQMAAQHSDDEFMHHACLNAHEPLRQVTRVAYIQTE
jgi:hypothetical protein